MAKNLVKLLSQFVGGNCYIKIHQIGNPCQFDVSQLFIVSISALRQAVQL